MLKDLSIPTVEDVERIKNIQDPLIRNLQITQCYHELSLVLAQFTGAEANWCTFATWASKQAGQTIRKEDLARLLERALAQSLAARRASAQVTAAINLQRGNQLLRPQDLALSAENFQPAIERASAAVARGNKKVFEEIGEAFAHYYQACFPIDQADQQKISGFCAQFRPGEPPDGQGYLAQAFTHYSQALVETNPKTRAELILLANLEIGFHEQTRLQPEIAESLDSGLVSFLDFTRALFRSIFPANGWFHLAQLVLFRLLGRPTELDRAVQALLGEVQLLLRQAITEMMMTISLPSGIVRLGKDISSEFPEKLQQITSPELSRFLEKHDLTLGDLSGSGALNWADLPDRLHFIIDLFRCFQEQPDLFDPPFTPEQVKALKDGRRPGGRL